MRITFGEARQFLAQYAGRGGACPDAKSVPFFVIQVLEYLLISGAYGSIRKFTFQAVNGAFTIPYELEVPEKVKLNNIVGSVWDRWFEFQSVKDLGCDCVPAGEALFEDPNYYPTVYDVPLTGAKVGALGTCLEADDAHIIVQGQDPSGREVFTTHKGTQIAGEYLSIQKGTLKYTSVTFGKITGIIKSKTVGYVQLYGINPVSLNRTFLSDYSPLEERPAFRRFRLTTKYCQPLVKVEVLGKIRLKSAYADSDFIPFDNLLTLNLAAQAVQSYSNNDMQTGVAKDSTMVEMISRENTSKRIQNGQPLDVQVATSPGMIRNIVS